MKKKRRRIPITKGVNYARCKDCPVKYKGIIRNAEGKVERVISCQTNCLVLISGLVTGI